MHLPGKMPWTMAHRIQSAAWPWNSPAVCEVARLWRPATKSKVAPLELCRTREGLGWHHDTERGMGSYDAMAH
jgi:hypothetical protein